MLVLSRQRDEVIKIGDQIEITVVDIRGDKVRLGISAPSKIAVHRKEVYEAITKENEQAAAAAGHDLAASAGGIPITAGPMRLVKRAASRLAVSAPQAPPAAQDPPGTGTNGLSLSTPGGATRGKVGTRVAGSEWTARSA